MPRLPRLLFATTALALGLSALWLAWPTRAPVAAQPPAPSGEAGAGERGGEAAVDAGIEAMQRGLTDIRQAAKNGDPGLLQESEREILAGLLQALDASLVGDPARPDPARYRRVVAAVDQVAGLFKYVPYELRVEPGDALPPITLRLRRSAYPVVLWRDPPLAWRASQEGDALVLRPPAKL